MAGIEFIGEPFVIRLKIREYSKEYQTIEDLQAVEQREIPNSQKVKVNETRKVYQYQANGTSGNYAPFDQMNNTGYWVEVVDGSYISFTAFSKVRAYLVHRYLNHSVIAFSNAIEPEFKPMVDIDEFTKRLVIESKESSNLKPGPYHLEIHKHTPDVRFESGEKIEIQKIKLWTLKDSVL